MNNEGFSRSVRLRRSADFRRIQRHGTQFRTRHLIVCFSPRDSEECRFGVTVSKKVGNAVVRNRVKRWLREGLRRHQSLVGGVDVVVIARPSAATAGLVVLSDEIENAFGSYDESDQ